MFPWKGYAGFRFVDSKGKEGEFDLVIVTHCNVIIVELKDWNHAPVTANGDVWYKGDKNMGRSPVSVTRSKQYTLSNKLKKLSQRFTNKGYTPFVEYFVVMTEPVRIFVCKAYSSPERNDICPSSKPNPRS